MKRFMPRTRRTRFLGGAVLGGALAVGAAACGSSTTPSASAPTTTSAPSSHAGTMEETFGSDCSMLAPSGMGSLHSMSMESVLTAASHNPLLTTWAADVKSAGLEMTVDDMHGITVFAPSNEAFSMAPSAAMTMMHNTAELKKILEYTVVRGHVTPSELAHGMALVTLEGSSLEPSKMGSVYEVGKADIICGNITTANATVYVLNKVLTPMH